MSELGDKLAQHFNPAGNAVFDMKGGVKDEREPATGADSPFVVFEDTDGGRSIRAMTYNEIVDALVELGVVGDDSRD